MAARVRLTVALQQKVCAFIRAGGYPHVAAVAAGVPLPLFRRWLEQGREPKAAALYRDFVAAIDQAEAQTRLNAEMNTYKAKPVDWLKCGPGREKADEPGWTTAARPRIEREQLVPLLDHPEFAEIVSAIMKALEPHEAAHQAVLAIVNRLAESAGSA